MKRNVIERTALALALCLLLAACGGQEASPSEPAEGRVAELLDVMEREHAVSMERNYGQSQ